MFHLRRDQVTLSMLDDCTPLYRLWADGGTPWLGLGAGYEWLSFSTSVVSFGNEVLVERVSVRGWEVARVLFGWELWLVDWLAVGPVFEASLGFFNHADGTTLRDESMHGWLLFGLSGHVGP
jgi:hypothetical protein